METVTRTTSAVLLTAAVCTLAACGLDPIEPTGSLGGDAALATQPFAATDSLPSGKHALELPGLRNGFIYVPAGRATETPSPLLVLLHGATGRADNWEWAFRLADSLGVVLLATDSRNYTWDIVAVGVYGPDIAFLDAALDETFRHVSIDPTRIGIAGFSDGASYALSVGLSNGSLFTHIVAWSPGFSAPTRNDGLPRVFVSHGTDDAILSVQNARGIVEELRASGFDVRYEEFAGRHEIPDTIVRGGLSWFLQD